jgi:hypothetical protein
MRDTDHTTMIYSSHLKFRNYVPKDVPLRKHHIRPAPRDVVADMEEHFKAELTKVDDEVRSTLIK